MWVCAITYLMEKQFNKPRLGQKIIFVSKIIDKFSDLKTLNISKETKIYRHNWKQRTKISITAKFKEEIF